MQTHGQQAIRSAHSAAYHLNAKRDARRAADRDIRLARFARRAARVARTAKLAAAALADAAQAEEEGVDE